MKLIFTEESLSRAGRSSPLPVNQFSFSVYDLESKSLHKVPLNENLEDTTTKNRPHYRPFGITVHKGEIFVVSNSKLCVFDKDTFEFKRSEYASINENTHELYSDSKTLWIVDTSRNRIVATEKTLYGSSERILTIQSSKNSLPNTRWAYDYNHVNSFAVYKNDLLVLESNISNKQREPARLTKLDRNFNLINKYALPSDSPHSLKVKEDSLWFVGSGDGNLHHYDLKSNRVIDKHFICNPRMHWMRGLALFKNLLYIGIGTYRGIESRKENRILVFDMTSKRVVDTIYIEGCYSAINQINTLF